LVGKTGVWAAGKRNYDCFPAIEKEAMGEGKLEVRYLENIRRREK